MKLFGARMAEREPQAGSALQQIAALTEANRRDPDPARERRIVRLRHDAFAELDSDQPAPLPEPDFDGLETVDGMPSVPLERFTPEALRAAILTSGCLLIRGVVGREECGALIESIERAFAAREAAGDDPTPGDPYYSPLAVGSGSYNLARQRQWVTSAGGLWTADSPRDDLRADRRRSRRAACSTRSPATSASGPPSPSTSGPCARSHPAPTATGTRTAPSSVATSAR